MNKYYRCAKCGEELAATASSCPRCGHPVAFHLQPSAGFSEPETLANPAQSSEASNPSTETLQVSDAPTRVNFHAAESADEKTMLFGSRERAVPDPEASRPTMLGSFAQVSNEPDSDKTILRSSLTPKPEQVDPSDPEASRPTMLGSFASSGPFVTTPDEDPEASHPTMAASFASAAALGTPPEAVQPTILTNEGLLASQIGGSAETTNEEKEEEERKRLLGLNLLPGAALLPLIHGQPATSAIPMVQGTPIANIPMVSGTPVNPAAGLGQAASGPGAAGMPGASGAPATGAPPAFSGPTLPHTTPKPKPPTHTTKPPTHINKPPTPGCLIPGLIAIVVAIIIIVTVILSGILPFGSPTPSITLQSGTPLPGGQVGIHGSGFFAGGTVVITGDGQQLSGASARPSLVADMLLTSTAFAQPAAITVRQDGTFDATITLPLSWDKGSHTLQASEQGNGHTASANLSVPIQVAAGVTPTVTPTDTPTSTPTTTPTPTATPTPTPVPITIPAPFIPPTPAPLSDCLRASTTQLSFSAVQRQPNPGSKTMTFTNCGAFGNWSATVTSGGSWLTISARAGQLNTGATQALTVSVHDQNLASGSFKGQIKITLNSQVRLVAVSLKLAPPPQPACIQPSATGLSFVGGASPNGSDPRPQGMTVTNCGPSGTLTATVSVDVNVAWLQIKGGGSVNAQGTLDFTVTALSVSTNLDPGTYSGQITFHMKNDNGLTTTAVVAVTLQVVNPIG